MGGLLQLSSASRSSRWADALRAAPGQKSLCRGVTEVLRPYKISMVGVTGLEPATFWSRTKRSTRLSYTPKIGRLPPRAARWRRAGQSTEAASRLQCGPPGPVKSPPPASEELAKGGSGGASRGAGPGRGHPARLGDIVSSGALVYPD